MEKDCQLGDHAPALAENSTLKPPAVMRALMLSPAMPATTGGGLAMRMGIFLRGLTQIAETDLLVLPRGGLESTHAELDRSFPSRCTVIPVEGREDTLFNLISRLKDPSQRIEAFEKYGRSSLAASVSAEVLRDVARATAGKSYDLIHVGRSYLAEALQPISQSPLRTLDADEDDADLFRQRAAKALENGEPTRAAFHALDAKACASAQAKLVPEFDMIFASSHNEARKLRHYAPKSPIRVIDNACLSPPPSATEDNGGTLLFVGSLNYWPNAEGLKWFAGNVWPLLQAASPRPLNFWIVGRNSPPEIAALSSLPGISVFPDVADVYPYYAKASLAVVPLQIGGGTRIKIIEAAMHGVPVVSTSAGAEGLPFIDGREIWIADTAAEMGRKILAGLQDREAARALAQRARRVAESQFSVEAVVKNLTCQWKDLLIKR